LILALSPQRQAIQEWARYRHQDKNSKSLWRDLIFGEKSPSGLAIAINLVLVWTPSIIWVFLRSQTEDSHWLNKTEYLLGVILFASLTIVYSSIAQLILLVKSRKRYVWVVSTLGLMMFLPSVIPPFLGGQSYKSLNSVFLFSPFPWAGVDHAGITAVYMSILCELSVAALLNFQLARRLKVLGESSSKALLAGK
jgi:hypothetical protein